MISYFGGKNRIGEFIYPYFPKQIDTYLEPFSGAFWLYFNLKHDFSNIKNIIYNDINKYLVNLFQCAQDYEKLLERYEYHLHDPKGLLYTQFTPGSPEWKDFYKNLYYSYNSRNRKTMTFLDEPNFNLPDFDAAVLYSFLQLSTFNGCHPNPHSGASVCKEDKLKLEPFLNKLRHFGYQNKLHNITQFENLDFETLIKKYDGPNTYLYLDPPYNSLKDTRLEWYGADDESVFGYSSHQRLSQLLKETQAKWSLSYYHFPELEEWFPKDQYTWASKEFFRSSASFSENKSNKGEELLIMNYDPTQIETRTINNISVKKSTTPKKKMEKIVEEVKDSISYETSGLSVLDTIEKKVEPTNIEEDDNFWN